MLNHSLEHMSAHVRRWFGSAAFFQRQVESSSGSRPPDSLFGITVRTGRLDPPRHQYVHTLKSLELTAKQAGLRVADVQHDSWSFQFWGSEQSKRGIP